MATKIYCRTIAKGRQAFYLSVRGEDYYLFEQDYRVSNKEYFAKGISVSESRNFRNIHSKSVIHTLEKFPAYIKYIEKEYGIAVYEKTKNQAKKKYNKVYKRKGFDWQDYIWEDDVI